MSIIGLSLLLRRTSVVWSYEKSTGGKFWETAAQRLGDALSPRAVYETGGSFQHGFFLLTDKDLDACLKAAVSVISDMLAGVGESADAVSITAKGADPAALAALMQKTGATSGVLWNAVKDALTETAEAKEKDTAAPPEKKSKEEAVPPKKREKRDEKPAETPSVEERREAKAEENAPPTLAEQAEKIRALREALLSRVRGQRHAVEETVQSIFECEMFASQNPKRKGPLASFLFTGPSGVGKTFLAESLGALLGRPMLVVDMSEYSDNLANNKFNGDHGQPATVTGFVHKHPNGIILFDEVEKAHINTIHLFLQILDFGRLMDCRLNREVSFRDTIVIMTTNAGRELYDDVTVSDLSATPRSVILDALRKDKNAQTGEAYFPECITTRMANGHVILFNHLDPYSLTEILCDELRLQMGLFEKASGVKVEYDEKTLSALLLYHGGGVSDARTLRGLARNVAVRELQEIVTQMYAKHGEGVDRLSRILLHVQTEESDEARTLFAGKDKMRVSVFTDASASLLSRAGESHNACFEVTGEKDAFLRRARGVVDCLLIDPTCGMRDMTDTPSDIEDVHSEGMEVFDYLREYLPDVPVYILDRKRDPFRSFDTLLKRGARGVITLGKRRSERLDAVLDELSFSSLINNTTYSLGRSGKYLAFNCAQYVKDADHAIVSFERLRLKSAPLAEDSALIARKESNGNLGFKDVIGCKAAKEALMGFASALDDPRKTALSGKRMPRGVLLYGPPGTGKTMLARAMANECGATFFPTSATAFFGSLVGETERNIRDLFRRARKYAPAIIFVDEVDAIGRMRIGGSSTAHNEDALNTFLAEMDGFSQDERRPVFILAATNYEVEGDRGRVLDPAFVRRFDRKILVPLPDTEDRYALLKLCLGKHGLSFGEGEEQILRNMAERTGGMSNADLDMMTAQFARAVGDGTPTSELYMDTLDGFRFGEVNGMDKGALEQTACHEAGHALVARLCGTTPTFLTVVSRGSYGGFMESASDEGRGSYTRSELMDVVCRCLAGRAAEILVYGEGCGLNTGASSDVEKAKYFVRRALSDYAMGEHFFVRDDDFSEAEALIRAQYTRATELLQTHMAALSALSALLSEKKSLDKTQMESFFRTHGV